MINENKVIYFMRLDFAYSTNDTCLKILRIDQIQNRIWFLPELK